MGWRDYLPVHPAADLFPLMSELELRELGEDIKTNGLRASIVVYKDRLLDGRNRLDAMELVGVKFGFMAEQGRETENKFFYLHACDGSSIFDGDAALIDHFDGDPYDCVLSLNVHRRHLTSEQKRELIAKVLKAKPEASNRKIAKQTKADHKTVAAVRGDLESTGEIPQLEKTTGADGKQRKSRAKKADGGSRTSKSSEVSGEQRRADHAALDDPIEDDEREVADPATVEDYALHSLGRMIEHARVFKKVFKLSSFDREAEVRISTAIDGMMEKWGQLADNLAGADHVVERCLSLLMAMNKDQRGQFFAKYTELSAAKLPARA